MKTYKTIQADLKIPYVSDVNLFTNDSSKNIEYYSLK